MLSKKHGLIIEGLAKVDYQRQNKVLIDSLKSKLEKGLRTIGGLGDSMNGRPVNFRVGSLRAHTRLLLLEGSLTLEVYQEGDLTVIGLPLSQIRFIFDIDKEYTRQYGGKLYYQLMWMGLYSQQSISDRGFLSTSEVQSMEGNPKKYHEVMDKYFEEINGFARGAGLRTELREGAYPTYKRRDCLPLLSIDFKKGNMFTFLGGSMMSTSSTKNIQKYSLDRISNVISDLKKFFPANLAKYEILVKIPASGYEQWHAITTNGNS